MPEATAADRLSPLDQIRRAEAEITRNTIAARALSDQKMAEARAQAALIKKTAREKGEREGRMRHKQIVAEAETHAKMILAQAQQEMESLRQNGQARMEQAVTEAVNIALGAKGDGKVHEP